MKHNKPQVCLCLRPGSEPSSELDYADLLEYRVDLSPDKGLKYLGGELQKLSRHGKPIILTNRSRTEGGEFKGSEDERINLMKSLLDYVNYIDVELSTGDHLRDMLIKKAKDKGIKSILSFHDFSETPSGAWIESILEKELALGDMAKVAFKVNNPWDILSLYQTCLKMGEGSNRIIAIPMGSPLGRIAGFLFDVPIFYSGDMAPGQLSARQTRELLDLHAK
ncbi:MAG: type I 3-dehydroquinate dehydratase [Candidatus Altiarchaeota archaeon]|nr:type I 3-dehydroquinate dehydratase [Candidatus Altiarchaeota archaeon]